MDEKEKNQETNPVSRGWERLLFFIFGAELGAITVAIAWLVILQA